jgi:3',5'-cyclic AMP phosphodiesterase CpdA
VAVTRVTGNTRDSEFLRLDGIMKLYGISDLHLNHAVNRQALEALPAHPHDWLVLAGDIGETEECLEFALSILTRRFAQVLWAPGNHDLWTLPSDRSGLRGEAKYHRLVSICRNHGVFTPEDPYVRWPGVGLDCLLAPLFILYDYSYRPDDVAADKAIEWAAESGVLCTDEALLHSHPYPSRSAWCIERCLYTESRLQEAASIASFILINHFPLRQDLVRLVKIPRFSLWCGTRRTEDWHIRFPVSVVVYGHLHMRATHVLDGVRFEEVSLGYPRDWNHQRGLQGYLQEILPGSSMPQEERRQKL